jgi:hypothetical protein
MIVIYHKDHRVSRVFDFDNQKVLAFRDSSIAAVLIDIAHGYPERLLIWCNLVCQEELNLPHFSELFHHKKMLLSYHPYGNYFPLAIGYIEDSPFINVNKAVSYPTWQMSSLVGGVHASVLLTLNKGAVVDTDFDYFLCSFAKLGMPLGLLCYSEPKLLKGNVVIQHLQKPSLQVLLKFVKQHYKSVWVVLLFLNVLIYEKRIPFFPFLFSWFHKKRRWSFSLDKIIVQSTLQVVEQDSIDVIIPTIGRKRYLYDVLCDLKKQTHLPTNVIIVEQNPLTNSVSELDFINVETWPFNIKHTFTHQAGACNARNIALQQVESEWVFLNDDDNRFGNDLIEKAFLNIEKYGILVLMTSYLQLNEKRNHNTISQTTIFGSGNSFLNSILLKKVSFKKSLEFGYGEDIDFGLQLRNIGTDVVYFPEPSILHLKAPIGGFRIKPVLLWSDEKIQPKPSPTLMLLKESYDTKQQIQGYKLVLFLKLFKSNGWKSPIRCFTAFEKQWEASLYWAKQLQKK